MESPMLRKVIEIEGDVTASSLDLKGLIDAWSTTPEDEKRDMLGITFRHLRIVARDLEAIVKEM